MIEIIQKNMPISEWSRPFKNRHNTKALVIHWVQNPTQSADSVFKYFSEKVDKFGSAQFIIGLKGEILQTMESLEIAYHCGSNKIDPASGKIYTDLARKKFGKYCTEKNLSPNLLTVGIECCHTNNKGEMTSDTIKSLVELCAKLCNDYNLNPMTDILTHKDIVGYKDCHKYYVDNKDKFETFKKQVNDLLVFNYDKVV